MPTQSLPPSPIHPLITRERTIWARYQDVADRKGNDAIANCFFPFVWGIILAKVDNEAMGRAHLGVIDGAAPVLDAIEKGLDHVERIYGDIRPSAGADR